MDENRTAPRSPRAALEPDRVVIPVKHSKRVRHPLVMIGNAIFTGVLLLALVIGGGAYWGKLRTNVAGPLPSEKVVNIPRGGSADIADLLLREGVIDSQLPLQRYVFIASATIRKWQGDDLKAGEYQFEKQASLRDVIDTMVDGKVVQHQFTVPEGLTSEQIVAKLLENNVLSGNIKEIPREGTLLPESYRFTRGMTREQMIQRMQQEQRRILAQAWERRVPDLPIRTPEQLTVLASIIEKETGVPDERTRVAAVFVNRLKTRMRLQSDPTIIYGLVGGKGSLGRPIMKSEIEQPTPYNTYVIEGLPPGPIANPGRASLEAAANPARTKELYFVADGSGGHAFADNYEQHLRNVAKLRALERETKDAVPPGSVLSAQPAATPAPPTANAAPPAPAPRGARSSAQGQNGAKQQ